MVCNKDHGSKPKPLVLLDVRLPAPLTVHLFNCLMGTACPCSWCPLLWVPVTFSVPSEKTCPCNKYDHRCPAQGTSFPHSSAVVLWLRCTVSKVTPLHAQPCSIFPEGSCEHVATLCCRWIACLFLPLSSDLIRFYCLLPVIQINVSIPFQGLKINEEIDEIWWALNFWLLILDLLGFLNTVLFIYGCAGLSLVWGGFL